MPSALIPIMVPEVGTSEIVLSAWYVYPGETVYAGDRVVEILIPGATIDICAPTDGVLVERCYPMATPVQPGTILGYLKPTSDCPDSAD
jgi:pyruvate/2-oxoglutarate dehydrogenase complex dihydrolipoamide acyltransferase (E2) component